jgi:Cys-tRNA(Pro)/Cys-tRNA(Cys) deacylase
MTPAIAQAEAAGIEFAVHEFEAKPGRGFGERASASLGLPSERVFKTLVAQLDGARLVVAILPVDAQLDLKRLAAAAGAKRAAMAPPRDAERRLAVVGAISPPGNASRRPPSSTTPHWPSTIYASGGRRLELELALAALSRSATARRCGSLARDERRIVRRMTPAQ